MGTTGQQVEVPVRAARLEREGETSESVEFRILGDEGGVLAVLEHVGPAVWVEGPAPAFWDQEDIWCAFLDSAEALLELDGQRLPGTPWRDEIWVPKLGRELWSAHVALAEVRVEPVR